MMSNGSASTTSSEQMQRVAYCKEHNIHHLLELLAARVLVERPANPFAFLRQLLTSIEASEQRRSRYDATRIPSPTASSSSRSLLQHTHDDGDDTAAASDGTKHDNDGDDNAAAAATTVTCDKDDDGGDNAEQQQHDTPAVSPSARVVDSSTTTTTTTTTPSLADAGGSARATTRYKITLGLFGLDNAGKTTVLSQLEGEVNAQTLPTVGFTPAQFQTSDSDVYVFDLGGAGNFRGIWSHYFHDCHGIIYVVDAAADDDVVQQALQVLRETMSHACMRGKPLLLLANKKDLACSRGTAVVPLSLLDELSSSAATTAAAASAAAADAHTQTTPHATATATPCRVVATCALTPDEALEHGIEWLLRAVRDDYDALRRRVERDTAAVRAAAARARAEQLAQLRKDE